MKIRCTHNSIRLRLRKSDIAQLLENETIKESLSFGGGISFDFVLSLDKDATETNATYLKNQIIVYLPHSMAYTWSKSTQVSLENYQSLDNDEQLYLLIEKDFPCKDRSEENKDDTFWELTDEEGDKC